MGTNMDNVVPSYCTKDAVIERLAIFGIEFIEEKKFPNHVDADLGFRLNLDYLKFKFPRTTTI